MPDTNPKKENVEKILLDHGSGGKISHSMFSEMILADIKDEFLNSEKSKREMENVINELKILAIKEKLTEVTVDIKRFESAKKTKKLKVSQRKFSKLTRELTDLEEN